jgi:hypothetical protein
VNAYRNLGAVLGVNLGNREESIKASKIPAAFTLLALQGKNQQN